MAFVAEAFQQDLGGTVEDEEEEKRGVLREVLSADPKEQHDEDRDGDQRFDETDIEGIIPIAFDREEIGIVKPGAEARGGKGFAQAGDDEEDREGEGERAEGEIPLALADPKRGQDHTGQRAGHGETAFPQAGKEADPGDAEAEGKVDQHKQETGKEQTGPDREGHPQQKGLDGGAATRESDDRGAKQEGPGKHQPIGPGTENVGERSLTGVGVIGGLGQHIAVRDREDAEQKPCQEEQAEKADGRTFHGITPLHLWRKRRR